MGRMVATVMTTLMALVAALPALGTTNGLPQIVDQAGDANGINGQWYDYGTVGAAIWFVYDGVFGGDPFGEGQRTEGSYGPGDLRAGRLETMYEAVPVGDDGIDHRATGVRLRIGTEERPEAPDGTRLRLGLFLTQYDPDGTECPTRISTRISGADDPGRISWFRDSIGGCSDVDAEREPSGWKAFRDGNEVVFEMPASALSPSGAAFFSEGALFMEPHAFAELEVVTLDASPAGSHFVVGEDMPADVPCTSGCPSG